MALLLEELSSVTLRIATPRLSHGCHDTACFIVVLSGLGFGLDFLSLLSSIEMGTAYLPPQGGLLPRTHLK